MKQIIVAAVAATAVVTAACRSGGGPPSPTASPSGVASSTPSPAATPAALPERPAQFEDLPAAIAGYLTETGGSSDCLAALFEAWEMPLDGTANCAAADLDGDGEVEYVVRPARAVGPDEGAPADSLAGTVFVFDQAAGSYEAQSLIPESPNAVPLADGTYLNAAIFAVEDFNGDGTPEIAVTTSHCGAHTCLLALYVMALRGGSYVVVVAPSQDDPDGIISAPVTSDQVRFEDVDGDGVRELLFRVGLIGSVGAGPQRESVRTYTWDGERYAVTGTEYEPSDLRYFKVREADDAFAEEDYASAETLYREAVDDAGLQDVEGFGDPAELVAYARFRIGLSLAAEGDNAGALAALDQAIDADPDALHSQLAARFRQAYGKVGAVSSGCLAGRDFISGQMEAFAELWNYGYANPEFDAGALCPL